MTIFLKVENIEIYMDRIWRWRHRSRPEAEKSSAQYKFAIDYNKKELGRYLLPVLRKKYKTDHHLKKYPP